jgi:hypothetical protein
MNLTQEEKIQIKELCKLFKAQKLFINGVPVNVPYQKEPYPYIPWLDREEY